MAALLACLTVVGTARAQTVEQRLESAIERLDRARADHLDIISPRNFERAAQKIAEARQRLATGGRIADIDGRVEEAYAELDAADALASVGNVLLGDALQARGEALAVNAPKFADRDWQRAEQTARDAGRRIESNDQNGARERAGRAENEYREAELNAIRADILGRARTLREEALDAKADRRAAFTLNRADSLLTAAEVILAEDRSRIAEAGGLATDAASEYRHATRLSALADSVDRNRVSVETTALRAEGQVRRMAELLRYEADFADGIEPVVNDGVTAIESLYGERDGLHADLASRGREIERLETVIDSMDRRLAAVEQREAAVAAELRERQRWERRLREVQAMFTPQEGEALLGEDRLILRLVGLTFASGSAEIRPDNFSLLTKVQRVIREFPESAITVEGHTDSQGNEAMNQELSRRRAIAVREYLLLNIAISANRITAVGYGESRPVAPNDTEAGRSRNRRIEITLSLESN
jgi:outer membrane protein OmpA-like peptidoglycan-associated protein